jgi:hypothetical protein
VIKEREIFREKEPQASGGGGGGGGEEEDTERHAESVRKIAKSIPAFRNSQLRSTEVAT